jgi:ABC-type branched-subunit amino acid transport system substrate-binding protein
MASIPYGFLVHFIALLAYGVAVARADIIIGAPYPATGPNSWLGSPTRVGVERAVQDQNNSKDKGLLGQRLDIIWENDRCDSDQAVTAARKLINSRADSSSVANTLRIL